MDKRFAFNEDVKNYDRWRPTYCKELFNDIAKYSKLDKYKKVIEVGIGTGQATKPFLIKGCDVTAIELGKDLAKYSKEKFKNYKNFNVYNISFENFECDDNTFDILYFRKWKYFNNIWYYRFIFGKKIVFQFSVD